MTTSNFRWNMYAEYVNIEENFKIVRGFPLNRKLVQSPDSAEIIRILWFFSALISLLFQQRKTAQLDFITIMILLVWIIRCDVFYCLRHLKWLPSLVICIFQTTTMTTTKPFLLVFFSNSSSYSNTTWITIYTQCIYIIVFFQF